MRTINPMPALGLSAATGFILLCQASVVGSPSYAQDTSETPQNILAAQIRRQGFTCDEPQSATRDLKLQKPDEAAWTLKCKNATYLLRLVPNQAAKVQVLD